MRYLLLILMACLAGGCTFKGKLNRVETWKEDYYMTIGDTVYSPIFGRNCLRDHHLAWLDTPPKTLGDTLDCEAYALLLHEQVHAMQQKGAWRFPFWALRYGLSARFRWRVEQEGYRIEVRTLIDNGHWSTSKRDQFAAFMSTHYRGMISREDAVAWLNAVERGQ